MPGPTSSDDRSISGESPRDSHSITRMIQKLRSDKRGDFDEAAAAIWTRYFSDLLHLARRNLSPGLRQREDEDDLLQSVYKSFCVRHRDGKYDLQDRDDLWSLLVKMTRNKARNVAVRHGRRRRDYRRESHPTEKSDSGGGDYQPLDVAGPGAAPYDQMIFGEALQQIAALDDSLQKLALWKLAGCTNEEIASEKMMHCALRTVERKLNRIREIWDKQQPA